MPDSLEIHTHEFFPKQGGIGRYCSEFAKGASAIGWSVTVRGPQTALHPPGDGPEHYQLRTERFGSSHGALNLLRSRKRLAAIFQAKPESLHLLAEPGPILACGLLPGSALPEHLRLVFHGSEVERWAPSPTLRLIARRAMRRARAMIVPSEAIANRLRVNFPEFSERIKIVPHALPGFFRKAAEAIASPEADQHEGKIKLLSVGRIHPRKGFDQVLTAIMQLKPEEQAQIHYTIAGSRCHARYEQSLREQARMSPSEVDFSLDPDDDALVAHYRAADFFILTSVPHRKSVEGFGLVYLEAAAFGLPSLAYRTGGVEAAIQDGVTGHVLPAGHPEAITAKLRSLLERETDFAGMGRQARKSALSRDWGKVAESSLR